MSHIPIVWVFQLLGSLIVPLAKNDEQYDAVPATLAFLLTMASMPITTSFIDQSIHNKRKNQSQQVPGDGPQKFAFMRFNDWKYRFLFQRHRQQMASLSGGGLYRLLEETPRYKKFPPFSSRGSDCFVACLDDAGIVEIQVRLSLIHALDLQSESPLLLCQHVTHTIHQG
ncbi:Aste57867_14113 [Aphanomyces stellatus]|uniref:Aste57867_14113 protein n=1 Tax=Aphanomyces stellatus TaxID=120398 RepID=A0A485KZU3_9STRA|nr:hypothetical protein As57867_014062 [Aphanomyces stellatus]VFT90940.1 Aste57867_14113 [Aphanomyces stellatus]